MTTLAYCPVVDSFLTPIRTKRISQACQNAMTEGSDEKLDTRKSARDMVGQRVKVQINSSNDSGENFIETYRRVGVEPFKEAVYGPGKPTKRVA